MSRGPLCGATNPLYVPTPGSYGHCDASDPTHPVLIAKTAHPHGATPTASSHKTHAAKKKGYDFGLYDSSTLGELGLLGQIVSPVLGVKYGQPYTNEIITLKNGKEVYKPLGAKFNAKTGELARDNAGDKVLRCVAFVDDVLSQYLRGSVAKSVASYDFKDGEDIFSTYGGRKLEDLLPGEFAAFSKGLDNTHLYGIQYLGEDKHKKLIPTHVVLLTYAASAGKWITLQASGWCNDAKPICSGDGVSIQGPPATKRGHVYDFGERKPADPTRKSPPSYEFVDGELMLIGG